MSDLRGSAGAFWKKKLGLAISILDQKKIWIGHFRPNLLQRCLLGNMRYKRICWQAKHLESIEESSMILLLMS